MMSELRDYCIMLTEIIPQKVYCYALIVFCLGIIISVVSLGWRKGIRFSVLLLFVEYVSMIYGNTIFFRQKVVERVYDYAPFWSYSEILKGNTTAVLPEMITNVVVFVPIGILTGIVVPEPSWKKVLLLGLILSVGIELLQLSLNKGFAEFDDVFHNTIGCMIGYGIYSLVRMGYEKAFKRHVAVL